jgi:uncharacterized protein YkwD
MPFHPTRCSLRALAALTAVLLAQGCQAPGARSGPAAAAELATPGEIDGARLSGLIVRETNRERLAHGMASLEEDPGLDRAADEQTSFMVLTGSAAHDNPAAGERNAADRVEASGVRASLVGENVILVAALRDGTGERRYTYGELAARIVGLWMGSPGHRANILNRAFTRIGCSAGLSRGPGPDGGRILASQVFVKPEDAAPSRTQLGQGAAGIRPR